MKSHHTEELRSLPSPGLQLKHKGRGVISTWHKLLSPGGKRSPEPTHEFLDSLLLLHGVAGNAGVGTSHLEKKAQAVHRECIVVEVRLVKLHADAQ